MNKTILITGSTDGIGKLAAINLAKEGHEIYLHGRNADKLAAVISEIKALSNNEKIHGFQADFSDLDAVKDLSKQVKEKLSKLDILINNAGVYKSPVNQTKDGLDTRFVVNYLAPYLLTEELLPLLKKGASPRIINLSSAAQATVSHDVLLGHQQISTQEAYAQSKLALTMWSFHLAELEPNIVVIPVNPGSLLNTKMVKEGFGRFWSSADKGGNILHDLAISEDYNNMSGKYFDNDQGVFGRAHSDAYNKMEVDHLIQETKTMLNLK